MATQQTNKIPKKTPTRKNNRAWTNRIHSKTKRIHTQTNKCIVVKLTAHMDRFLEHLNCALPFHTLLSELTWTVFQPLPKFTIESHECKKYTVRNVRYWKRFCDFIQIEWFIQNKKKALELIQATFFFLDLHVLRPWTPIKIQCKYRTNTRLTPYVMLIATNNFCTQFIFASMKRCEQCQFLPFQLQTNW